ncbi:MAG: ATPase domain-containing protein [Thermotogota bacterium]
MSKKKTKQKYYVCNNCGYESDKWFAKCSICNEMGSAVEFTADIAYMDSDKDSNKKHTDITYLDSEIEEPERLKLKSKQINKALNNGLVKGAVYLLSGEPGIGKSTLVSQLSDSDNTIIYISAEESKSQVMQRFKRLNIQNKNIGLIFSNSLETIFKSISKLKEKPKILIFDSIQTIKSDDVDSNPGSVLQVKECTRRIVEFSKKTETSSLLIGHVTKEGNVAGPKLLEHVVDCVISFEMEKTSGLRMFRINKNRYGPTDEIVLMEMTEKGLFPIDDLTNYFLSDYSNEPGNTLSIIKEGNKLIPIEIQSLVSKPVYGSPRRVSSGINLDKVFMITAVLSKKLKLPVESKDIFLNTSGGFRISDSSIDSAIAFTIISSLFEQTLERSTIFIGEIGLDGKIRNTSHLEKRIEMAKKIGIKNICVSKRAKINDKSIIELDNISDIVKMFKGGAYNE